MMVDQDEMYASSYVARNRLLFEKKLLLLSSVNPLSIHGLSPLNCGNCNVDNTVDKNDL